MVLWIGAHASADLSHMSSSLTEEGYRMKNEDSVSVKSSVTR